MDAHFNNYSCWGSAWPLPSGEVELSLVNKRIGVLDETQPWASVPNPLDARNNAARKDCQYRW